MVFCFVSKIGHGCLDSPYIWSELIRGEGKLNQQQRIQPTKAGLVKIPENDELKHETARGQSRTIGFLWIFADIISDISPQSVDLFSNQSVPSNAIQRDSNPLVTTHGRKIHQGKSQRKFGDFPFPRLNILGFYVDLF